MVYEGVDFNVEAIRQMQLMQFMWHKSYQHLWPGISEEKRRERLKELYNLINANGTELIGGGIEAGYLNGSEPKPDIK